MFVIFFGIGLFTDTVWLIFLLCSVGVNLRNIFGTELFTDTVWVIFLLCSVGVGLRNVFWNWVN